MSITCDGGPHNEEVDHPNRINPNDVNIAGASAPAPKITPAGGGMKLTQLQLPYEELTEEESGERKWDGKRWLPEFHRRKIGCRGWGKFSLRLSIVPGKRCVISLRTVNMCVGKERRILVMDTIAGLKKRGLSKSYILGKINNALSLDEDTPLNALLRAEIARGNKINRITVGQIIELNSSCPMLAGRKGRKPKQVLAQATAIRQLARLAVASRLKLSTEKCASFKKEDLQQVPLAWVTTKALVAKYKLLGERNVHNKKNGKQRTLYNHISTVKGLFTPEFKRHLHCNNVIIPKSFLNILSLKIRATPTNGPVLLRVSDFRLVCETVLAAVREGAPEAWMLVYELFCPSKNARYEVGRLDTILTPDGMINTECGRIALPSGVAKWLRCVPPFSAGSSPVSATQIRRTIGLVVARLKSMRISSWLKKPRTELKHIGQARIYFKFRGSGLKSLGISLSPNMEEYYRSYASSVLELLDSLSDDIEKTVSNQKGVQ
jgi:hypothetical protein